jgi:hypothetical protein
VRGKAGPCYVACGLALSASLIAALCLPSLGQECLQEEDKKFRAILEAHGYKTETMGLAGSRHEEYRLGKVKPSEENSR